MAAKPLKAQAIDWAAFDKLLFGEEPDSSWISSITLKERYGFKQGTQLGGRIFNKLKEVCETKKFKGSDGKWRNYYRIKK